MTVDNVLTLSDGRVLRTKHSVLTTGVRTDITAGENGSSGWSCSILAQDEKVTLAADDTVSRKTVAVADAFTDSAVISELYTSLMNRAYATLVRMPASVLKLLQVE